MPRMDGAPKKPAFLGEEEALHRQSRHSSPNSFRPKAGPKFRLTAKTELGEQRSKRLIFYFIKNRSSDDCNGPKGRGPQKSLLFWGRGGMTERYEKSPA